MRDVRGMAFPEFDQVREGTHDEPVLVFEPKMASDKRISCLSMAERRELYEPASTRDCTLYRDRRVRHHRVYISGRGRGSRAEAGDDPAHGGRAARLRGERNAATLRANVAWERGQSGTFDPETFTKEIGPKLSAVPLAAMMEATGLSRPYCAMIRRGAYVPHPRHWAVLGVLTLTPTD